MIHHTWRCISCFLKIYFEWWYAGKKIPPSIGGIHPRNFVAALNGTFVINATVISRPLKTALRSEQDRLSLLLLILALLVVLRLCCYLIDKTDTYCTYCVDSRQIISTPVMIGYKAWISLRDWYPCDSAMASRMEKKKRELRKLIWHRVYLHRVLTNNTQIMCRMLQSSSWTAGNHSITKPTGTYWAPKLFSRTPGHENLTDWWCWTKVYQESDAECPPDLWTLPSRHVSHSLEDTPGQTFTRPRIDISN